MTRGRPLALVAVADVHPPAVLAVMLDVAAAYVCIREQRGSTRGPTLDRDHSGGTSMTTHTATLPDVGMDIRWRDWQARGAASDRRTTARMRNVMLLLVAALIVTFVVQLA